MSKLNNHTFFRDQSSRNFDAELVYYMVWLQITRLIQVINKRCWHKFLSRPAVTWMRVKHIYMYNSYLRTHLFLSTDAMKWSRWQHDIHIYKDTNILHLVMFNCIIILNSPKCTIQNHDEHILWEPLLHYWASIRKAASGSDHNA